MSYFILDGDKKGFSEERVLAVIKTVFPHAVIEQAQRENYNFEIKISKISEVLMNSESVVFSYKIDEAKTLIKALRHRLPQHDWKIYDDEEGEFV